jgi:hypothetical protein
MPFGWGNTLHEAVKNGNGAMDEELERGLGSLLIT